MKTITHSPSFNALLKGFKRWQTKRLGFERYKISKPNLHGEMMVKSYTRNGNYIRTPVQYATKQTIVNFIYEKMGDIDENK